MGVYIFWIVVFLSVLLFFRFVFRTNESVAQPRPIPVRRTAGRNIKGKEFNCVEDIVNAVVEAASATRTDNDDDDDDD